MNYNDSITIGRNPFLTYQVTTMIIERQRRREVWSSRKARVLSFFKIFTFRK